MPRCSRNNECPESSRVNAPLVIRDAVDLSPVDNVGDKVADRRILDMERTIRELACKNLELEQNFNRRAHELEDTNA